MDWTTILGRRRWWLINVPLIILFIIVMVIVLPDAGASPPPESLHRVATATDDEGATCCPDLAKKMARKFRKDKLGNAKGIEFPKRIKKRIHRKMVKAGYEGRLDDDVPWYKQALKSVACIGGFQYRYTCSAGQRKVYEVMADTHRIGVICGGVAVIGSLGGGGGWGAGKGGLACLWTRLLGFWD